MANSGSFTTNEVEGRSLTFNWNVQSQSIVNNQTVINWSLVGSGSYTYGWVTCGNFKVIINGQQVYYSTSRINVYSGTVIASGTATITHNNDGNKTFSASAQAGIYYVAVNSSGSGSWALPQIVRNATITTAPNFTDIENPTITYSNPLGNDVTLSACISLTGSTDNVPYRSISPSGSSYTFNLTQEERNILLNATSGKSRTVYFYIRTIFNGNTYYSSKAVTFSVVNANPTIESISYEDVNASITAITGNNQWIVRNKSTLQITLTNLTALKGATLSSATVNINGVIQSFSGISGSSLSSVNLNFGTINVSSNINATIILTDSRGFSSTYTKEITVLNYETPYATVTLARKNNFYTQCDLLVDCTFSSLNNTNSITIQWQAKKVSESSYGALTTIQNNVQTTIQLDNLYQWNVKVIITDSLGSTVNYVLFVDKGIPIFFIDKKLNSIGINCFPKDNESLEISGLNVYDAIVGKVLYNSSGEAGTISLNDSVANYTYIEIFYTDNNGNGNSSVKVYQANGKNVDLSTIEAGGTTGYTYIRRTGYDISTNSITPQTSNMGYVLIDGSTVSTVTGTNYLRITRVIGYKN